jgi:acyl-CoA thioesterase FadM
MYVERAEKFHRSVSFSFTDLRKKGIWLPRVEAFCKYRKPARFDELLEVEPTVEESKKVCETELQHFQLRKRRTTGNRPIDGCVG